MEVYNSNNQNDSSTKKQCPFCASMMNVNCNYCPGCGSPMNIHEIQENSSRKSNSTNPNDNIVFGVLSLVFGALGGLLGLVFGFYGLFNKKKWKKYKNIVLDWNYFIFPLDSSSGCFIHNLFQYGCKALYSFIQFILIVSLALARLFKYKN